MTVLGEFHELDLPRALPRKPGTLRMGIFLPNQRNSFYMTSFSGGTTSSYESVCSVVKLADEIGLSFALTVAHWKGVYGRHTHFADAGLETVSLTGALLQATRRLTVISTIHTAVYNPAIVAKVGATLDQIGNGRWGLNVVAGWNEAEFRSLGLDFYDHAKRYEHAAAWLAVIRELWLTGRCSHKSEFFELDEAECRPRPRQEGGPVIVNAGRSGPGMRFAAENCDYLFSSGPAEEFHKVVDKFTSKETGFIGRRRVIVRRTQRAAEDVADAMIAGADTRTLAQMPSWADLPVDESEARFSDKHLLREALLADAIVGSPEVVAQELARWSIEAGIDCVCLTLFDMERELELLSEKVFPRLAELLSSHGRQLLLEGSTAL